MRPSGPCQSRGFPKERPLSAGTLEEDGTWTVEPGDLDGLSVTGAEDSDADFDLVVTVEVDIAPPTTTITTDNVLDGAGFEVTGRSIGSDGSLNDASADSISVTSDGFGVSGDASGPSSQLGHNWNTDVSEQMIVSFDEDMTSATVSVDRLYDGEGGSAEVGKWTAYLDGVEVGSDTFTSPDGAIATTFTIDLEGDATFDSIVFEAMHYEGGANG